MTTARNVPEFSEFSCGDVEITVKYTSMIHTFSGIMRLFSHEVSANINKLLPTLGKTLYSSAVKFPASTSQHLAKLCFNSLSFTKWRPRSASFTGPNGWQSQGAWCGLCAARGRTVHLVSAQAGVRAGTVVKENGVLYVSVRTNSTNVCQQFV
jgi:hypothetical protein